MPANYVLLEKITVGAAGAATVTFSGIPQTGYTDLVVKSSTRQTSASVAYATIKFNGSSANFTYRSIEGDGSTVGSFTGSTGPFGVVTTSGNTANTFSNIEFYIPNYTSSNYKSYSSDSVSETNAAGAYADLIAGLWSNTAAITSIELTPGAGNFAEYSTFYLYGVAALGTTPAIVPYATGGDTIMTDGTYWYHTFVSSGTFTPAVGKNLSCDYLVVAGGGGGGEGNSAGASGGGGAGGLRSTVTATGGSGSLESALSLASGTGYTVTIGAGGANKTSGSNSVFSTITSTGGGYGGTRNGNIAPAVGGSGGGFYGDVFGSASGANGTTNQGFKGGDSFGGAPNYYGGGGGGAGEAGPNATTSVPGRGGNGVATSISGSSVTYAGGGGTGTYGANPAGTGGTGGGGAGGYNTNGVEGTANTGGGGGGGAGNAAVKAGGAGGSGIVIVRYAV